MGIGAGRLSAFRIAEKDEILLRGSGSLVKVRCWMERWNQRFSGWFHRSIQQHWLKGGWAIALRTWCWAREAQSPQTLSQMPCQVLLDILFQVYV